MLPIRLIGSQKAVEGTVRVLRETGAEIATDSGTQPARKGGDGKVRRYVVARLAESPDVSGPVRNSSERSGTEAS
ncbi:hypothetical protein [Nonomuraea sp. GTA35]|uniref:hypothetical protein n=1 Tax=Nonomuraea sp. GTA35 TaxID=1676746 RepID=UPI0035C262C2